jgi:hypothetical protein
MPIRPNARLSGTAQPTCGSKARLAMPVQRQTVRIRPERPVRSASWPQAAPEKIITQLARLMIEAASSGPSPPAVSSRGAKLR